MPRLLNFFDGATQRMDRIRPEVVGSLEVSGLQVVIS